MLIKLNDDNYLDHSLISCIRKGTWGNEANFVAYCFEGGDVVIGKDPAEAERVASEVNKWREMEMQSNTIKSAKPSTDRDSRGGYDR